MDTLTLTPIADRTAPPTASTPAAGAPDVAPLDVRPFADYRLIVDARSPHEFDDDHVPGAVNMPVVDDAQYAQVGTLHRTDQHRAYLVGVAMSLQNIARQIPPLIAGLAPQDRILVYCFRGGKRSRLWADNLRTIGFEVDVLAGGWKRYRRWVMESLAALPETLEFRVLAGPTGCGKTRLLQALHGAGAQVLDLEQLAVHRGSLIGAVPGRPQPGQKRFESALFATLRGFDPDRPVWVEAESKKIGRLQIPEALHRAMHAASHVLRLDAPMAERVALWREDYAHFEQDPQAMLALLAPIRPLVGNEVYAAWSALAAERRTAELFERLMTEHYDPAYGRSSRRHYPGFDRLPVLSLQSLSTAALAASAAELVGAFPAAPPVDATAPGTPRPGHVPA